MANRGAILLPRAEVQVSASRLAPRPTSLAGKRVAFIDNDLWRSMHILVDEMAKTFTAESGVTGTETVLTRHATGVVPKEFQAALAKLSSRVDVALSGLGN